MPNDNNQKENNKELIEIAAEQFARLFWKQWLYMKESKKYKSRVHKTIVNRHNSDRNQDWDYTFSLIEFNDKIENMKYFAEKMEFL